MGKIKVSEKDIQSFILDYLNNFGFFWRNNTVGVYNQYKKVYMKNNKLLKGVPDILGVYKGRFMAIECKSSNVKKMSEDQEKFKDNFEKMGGLFYMANDIDNFISWFNKIRLYE